MVSRLYHSTNHILKFGLEDIYHQYKNDFFIEDYDFILLAVSPSYPYKDILPNIKKLNLKNCIAFNAINSFANEKIVDGITALFIKFEHKGSISTYYQDNFDEIDSVYDYLKNNKNDLHIIISSVSDNVSVFIEKLNKKIEDLDVFLFGGISSGDLKNNEMIAYQYIDNKIIKNGFMIISFKNVEFDNRISSGYRPIGPIYKVNLSTGNKIYVAEYYDASEIAKKLLKEMPNNDITNLWYSPIVILDDKEGEVPIARSFKSVKDGEYVEFFGPIPRHSNIKLSFATENMLLESDKKEALKMKEKLKQVELGLNFSCVVRQFALGDKQDEETKLYVELLDSPMFGFFTFGEIGLNKFKTTLKLYNQTSLICGIKEINNE